MLIRPFVADIAFRSLEYLRFQSEVSFRPYSCQAAVLFVDLSNYSKISAALSHKGAHTLSAIVNGYLGRLLAIVHSYGGDVVKFAGDAVLIVWEGGENDLEINLLTAAKCATELQEKEGSYLVEGTSFYFRIHCGLACGALESEIFAASTNVYMQRLYHSVSGESLILVSELVDIAKAGEICISENCLKYLGSRAKCKGVDGYVGCKLLTGVDFDDSVLVAIENHVEMTLSARLLRRNQRIEEEFIHPSVVRLLSHGGLSPTQIAQMRTLCVLFIAMTSNGSSVNWLMEVQSILDKNRCPSKYCCYIFLDPPFHIPCNI
jgi:class 3 adenylate cyclase